MEYYIAMKVIKVEPLEKHEWSSESTMYSVEFHTIEFKIQKKLTYNLQWYIWVVIWRKKMIIIKLKLMIISRGEWWGYN